MRYRYAKRSAHLLLLIGLAWFASGHGAVAQTAPIPTPDQSSHGPERSRLRGGWYPWDPYQYRDYRHGVPILTGFDVEIERALARIMGVELLLPDLAWQEHLAALAAGRADIAAGATYSNERTAFAYFSKPYRSETDVLILPSGASGSYPFRTIEQMLDTFAKQKFPIGVIAGFVDADDRVNAFIADPRNAHHRCRNCRRCAEPAQSSRRPDRRFLADRIVAATTVASPRRRSDRGASTTFSADIHFMLSRATQTPETLGRLDAAIDELKGSGEFAPSPIPTSAGADQQSHRRWFQVLVLVGAAAFALSGSRSLMAASSLSERCLEACRRSAAACGAEPTAPARATRGCARSCINHRVRDSVDRHLSSA